MSLSDLGIKPSKAAWCLTLDLQCLNDDGGLVDACLAAAGATLGSVRLPATQPDDFTPALVRVLRQGTPPPHPF